jgi:hypothetical protein
MTPISKDTGFKHPEDGMYMIEPAGEHLEREGGVMQVIDSTAIASIVEDFNAAAQDPSFSGMLIDHEHAKLDLQKETVAYGWLMGLQGRADGIYGKIRWTATGQAAVDGGDYRFFSTEYDAADMEVLSNGKPVHARPLKLDGLTLTNAPNNKRGIPITNRRGSESTAAVTSAGACRAFGVIVNRKRAALKCSFDHAWHLASGEYPALFATMAGAESGTAQLPTLSRAVSSKAVDSTTESEAKSASNRFAMLVSNRQVESKLPFEQAWNHVGREFPDLLARSHGRVLNRSAYFINPADQKKADALAPDVLFDLRLETQGIPDRGQRIKPVYLKCAFLSALKLLQDVGKSLEEAFAYLRENEPVFWARGVLSYKLEADDAVQFKDFEADKIGFGQNQTNT